MQMYDISLATADKVLRILADENFVYRTPSCGTFIKHDLQGELQIGFTENDYCSANSSAFRLMNLRRVKKALREENIVPFYVSYNDLLTPESAEKVFSGMEIETVYFGNKNLFREADNYFQCRQTGYDDVLLIMLSGFFSESQRFFCDLRNW